MSEYSASTPHTCGSQQVANAMTSSRERLPSSVKASEVYQVLTSLVIHSEQVRWARLNTFLVVSSIFLAAWVGVLVGTSQFPDKNVLLFILCIPSIVLGALWTRLGWRSGEYLDDFHREALEIEAQFPNGIPRPFEVSEGRRDTARRDGEQFTSSKWLIAAIPFMFAVLFLVLAFLSWRVGS